MFLKRKKTEERNTENDLVQEALRQLRLSDSELEKRLAYLEKEMGVYTVREHAS